MVDQEFVRRSYRSMFVGPLVVSMPVTDSAVVYTWL